MILKFDEYVTLNEGTQSVATFSEVRRVLGKLGWEVIHKVGGGDAVTIKKNNHKIGGHLKHNAAKDEFRAVDISILNKIRTFMIEDYMESHDPTEINSVPWEKWNLKNPFNRELKPKDEIIEPESEIEPELNIGQRLNAAKVKKDIMTSNEKYKDAQLVQIDLNDESSCFIMMNVNEKGRMEYNVCRSSEDRRPMMKDWYGTSNYKRVGDDHYFGKDNMRSFDTRFYKVLPNGTLDSKENLELRESKEISKNLKNIW